MARIKDYATAFMIYDSEVRELLEETCIAADGLPLFYRDAGKDEYGEYLRYVSVINCSGWVNGLPIGMIIQRRIYRNYCYIQKISGHLGILPSVYPPCYEHIGACKIRDAINEIFKSAEKQLREKRPEKFSDEPARYKLLDYIEEHLTDKEKQ